MIFTGKKMLCCNIQYFFKYNFFFKKTLHPERIEGADNKRLMQLISKLKEIKKIKISHL